MRLDRLLLLLPWMVCCDTAELKPGPDYKPEPSYKDVPILHGDVVADTARFRTTLRVIRGLLELASTEAMRCPGAAAWANGLELESRTDGWGRPLVADCASGDLTVRSFGADGVRGHTDDVSEGLAEVQKEQKAADDRATAHAQMMETSHSIFDQAAAAKVRCPRAAAWVTRLPVASRTDHWGRPMVAECVSGDLVVRSLGTDGVRGTDDDASWSMSDWGKPTVCHFPDNGFPGF